ncbi:hypothetical protein PPYR_12114 [Photinus pyralis]|uniref:G-protein coupled receptors family 1 profile domain-containing protein n=1 Tax=Photinus pyralis TaxID=7054 RepID=A0A1Y1L8B3_PHOPY|nr:uncharacterized protein LOC116176373 [Photinus pyralis]KAB0795275.1 hypothetical protein PPYR_12114 [Photinus pyralis]
MDVESNITLNDKAELTYSVMSSRLGMEIALTIFFIAVMCVDIAMFHTIFCYKRLRTVPNILFANWAIADLLCAMITPSGYKILSIITSGNITHEFLCFLEEFGATFHIAVNLFVIIVLIDWLIAAFFGRASEKFRDNYVLIAGVIWLIALVYGTASSAICFRFYSYFVHHAWSLMSTYCIIAVLVIGLQVSRLVQRLRQSGIISPTLNLTFGTIYAIGCILTIVQMMTLRYYGRAFETFVTMCLFGTNLVNFGVLMVTNSEFRTCFLMAIRCKRDDDDHEFDFHNPISKVTVSKQRLESESSSIGSQEFLTQIH